MGRVRPCHFCGNSPLAKGFPVPPQQLARGLTLVQVAVGAPRQVPALNPFSKGLYLLPPFPHLPTSTVEPPTWAPVPDFGDSSTWDMLPPARVPQWNDICHTGAITVPTTTPLPSVQGSREVSAVPKQLSGDGSRG